MDSGRGEEGEKKREVDGKGRGRGRERRMREGGEKEKERVIKVGWRAGEGDESRVHQQPRAPNYDAPPLPAASVASGNDLSTHLSKKVL